MYFSIFPPEYCYEYYQPHSLCVARWYGLKIIKRMSEDNEKREVIRMEDNLSLSFNDSLCILQAMDFLAILAISLSGMRLNALEIEQFSNNQE